MGSTKSPLTTACTGRSGDCLPDTLLLAPPDSCAERALLKLLSAAGMPHASTNGCVALTIEAGGRAGATDALRIVLPRALQHAIRGVFAQPATTERELVAAMLVAEPLDVLFEQVAAEWARTALSEGWVRCVYQPIVRASTGEVFGYEALVRAEKPDTAETIGARQLFFACEQLNLVHELDRQARSVALRDAALAMPDRMLLFMNIQPDAIYEPSTCLGETFDEAARRGMSLEQVVFEMNEPCLDDPHPHLDAVLEYVRNAGCAVALDNVGRGYSPLESITDLRPDYVKLDRELVADAPLVTAARHTLDAVVGLAARLQMQVVAQGVETPEQMRVCIEAGVDYLQGFLFARPSSAHEAMVPRVLSPFAPAA